MGKELLFQGELSGVISIPIASGSMMSSGAIIIKLDEPIEGVPEEILARSRHFNEFPFQKGDKVKIFGKIIRKKVEYWGKEYIILQPIHLWNETLQVGW